MIESTFLISHEVYMSVKGALSRILTDFCVEGNQKIMVHFY